MTTKWIASVVLLAGVAVSAGCGRSKGGQDPYTPDRVASVQRALKYHKVVITPFTVEKAVEEPGTAPSDCEKAAGEYLAQKKIFATVQGTGSPIDPDTLVVNTTVVALRIVSGGARFWGGALAGNSTMTLKVVAKDSTGAVVGDRVVTSDNNAMGAAWSFGASDRGLPTDMGPMVADAIIQLAQGPSAPAAAPAAPAAK